MSTGRTSLYDSAVQVAALMLLTFAVAAHAGTRGDVKRAAAGAVQERPPETIFFTLKNAGNFTTLIKAVEAAGLIDTLKGAGPFTLFAPTDDAFAKLPPGTLDDLLKPENQAKLRALLLHHLLPSKVMAADMAGLAEAKTAKRTKLKIETSGGLKVGGARVLQADVPASNGVIHAIDAVLVPEEK
jgi:uncharacterized surface protein with fasciclin (FAS1) repeats